MSVTIDDLKKSMRSRLNDAQYKAATFRDGTVIVVASAGSGKTRVLTERVGYLVTDGIRPERILMLTFTNAASAEMLDRASKLSDPSCKNVEALTYHSFCNKKLRVYGKHVGFNNYRIMTPSETSTLIKYVRTSDPLFDQYRKIKEFPSDKIVRDIMSKSINTEQSVSDILMYDKHYSTYRDYIDPIVTLSNMVTVYQRKSGLFTFDNLLLGMYDLLSVEQLCSRIAKSYDYIMVDEAQDTNKLQSKLLDEIMKYNRNIMIVGDISQSIYGFRGADATFMSDFADRYEDCKIIPLSTNYRSTQDILDLANSVMDHNDISWKYYDMTADFKHGDKPEVIHAKDRFDQNDKIIGQVQYYHHMGVPYSEIAVLSRSRHTDDIEKVFLEKHIPFIKRGGTPFLEKVHVADLMAYIQLLEHPYDMLAWMRILHLYAGISEGTAKWFVDKRYEPDFLVTQHKPRQTAVATQSLLNLHRNYVSWRDSVDDKSPLTIYDKIADHYLETIRYKKEYMREMTSEESKAYDEAKKDVKTLRGMLSRYRSFKMFLDDVALLSEKEETANGDCVVLSTIHSAKGLEWEVVIIKDCCNGMFPKQPREVSGREEDEEELRCFYVAMTRAKQHLTIMCPDTIVAKDRQTGEYISTPTSLSRYLYRSNSKFTEVKVNEW